MADMEKKKLPIGIEDFEEICTEDYYYVDKTGVIKELLSKRGKVNLFTRPRRFGKSLNMSMFRYFFQIGGDKEIFKDTQIARDTQLCEKYMGKFPVISVSLKSAGAADYKTARALMCSIIGDEALRFYELLSSDKLTAQEKAFYEQLITVDKSGEGVYAMPDAVLMRSLKVLSSLLEKHYGQKVVLLIDEYDVPLAKANEQGYYDAMIVLIRNMFGQALKTNGSLYLAVLTGCLRVARESIFTGLNNLLVFSITSAECADGFGFTDDEVRKMLEYYGLEDKYDVIKEWYDGYRFGNAEVYCPWDVINYVYRLLGTRTLPPQNYWINTSSNDVINRLLQGASFETRDEIERLIAGESVIKTINEELTYRNLYDTTENVWSLLYTTGYLTQRGEAWGRERSLAIPNREIQDTFVLQIRGWMQDKAREDRERLLTFCDAFRKADKEAVQRVLEEYLNETVSIRDTAIRNDLKENFYHGFLLGLLRFRKDWKVLSNRESGRGYADIVIEIFSEKTGIVIEVKYANDGNLDRACRAAIKQIEREGYARQPHLDGMEKIMKCGIACHTKNCRVIFENCSQSVYTCDQKHL